MSAFFSRTWAFIYPPKPLPKHADALRIGLLGASKIAPPAIIQPAQSHPEVIIAAVAARDRVKASAFARKHHIPIVHSSYQALIDDPSIDAVYISLPNGSHFEWALKSLQAGKHVLLEKPSTSNAVEAEYLFRRNDLLAQGEHRKGGGSGNVPVLLEAFHTLFHPAFRKFLNLIEPRDVIEGHATLELIKGYVDTKSDIRMNYDLSGGALMDCGAYGVLAIRQIFQEEPVECIEAKAHQPAGVDKRIDQSFKATWKFPNGGYGSISANLALAGGYPFPSLTSSWPRWGTPVCWAKHREVILSDKSLSETQEHSVQRTVTFWAYLLPTFWHRIDIQEDHTIRAKADKKVCKRWTTTRYVKEYGEHAWWTTYRWQLEEFVNRIKGRAGSGAWMEAEESIKQMKVIDSGYVKAGLPLRPTSALVR